MQKMYDETAITSSLLITWYYPQYLVNKENVNRRDIFMLKKIFGPLGEFV